MDADRRRAGRLERAHGGALGGQLAQRRRVADRRGGRARRLVAGARLQRERALSRGRDHQLGRDREGDLALAAEPAQPGGGEHDRVELALGELAQAGVDVAVQLLHPQVGAGGEQLGAAAQAGGADPGALGHVVERGAGADPGVARVLARRHGGDRKPLGHLARQVLGRVDADLGLARQQRPLDAAHEARLVARLAVGGDLDQLGARRAARRPGPPGPEPERCPGWRCEAPRSSSRLAALRRSSVTLPPRLALRLGLGGVEPEQLAQGAHVEVGVVAAGRAASSAGSARAGGGRRSPSPSPPPARGRPR